MILQEISNTATAGPAEHAALPSIIKGFRKLTHLDLSNVAQRSPILQVCGSISPQSAVLFVSAPVAITQSLHQHVPFGLTYSHPGDTHCHWSPLFFTHRSATNSSSTHPLYAQVAATAPALQLRVLKVSLIINSSHTELEPLRAVGALKSLEELAISFTGSSKEEVSLLLLRGLHNLRTLSLSTDMPRFHAGDCVRVRHLSEVLSKCSRLTELRVGDLEVAAGEVVLSPVLVKLVLSGYLCNCSWLERLQPQNCPHLQRVELTDISLLPSRDPDPIFPDAAADAAAADDDGAPAMERPLLARSGPVERAAAGLARIPASCVAWCFSPVWGPPAGLYITGYNKITENLGAQAQCLVPLRGSAAANALRHITFEGVIMTPGAIASIASIFPQVQSVRLYWNFFPTVLKQGAVAAIVNGWGSLNLLEISDGECGWDGREQSIIAQARAAVHRALTVRYTKFCADESDDYVFDPAAMGAPAQAARARHRGARR